MNTLGRVTPSSPSAVQGALCLEGPLIRSPLCGCCRPRGCKSIALSCPPSPSQVVTRNKLHDVPLTVCGDAVTTCVHIPPPTTPQFSFLKNKRALEGRPACLWLSLQQVSVRILGMDVQGALELTPPEGAICSRRHIAQGKDELSAPLKSVCGSDGVRGGATIREHFLPPGPAQNQGPVWDPTPAGYHLLSCPSADAVSHMLVTG